jgi:hypothetical protein
VSHRFSAQWSFPTRSARKATVTTAAPSRPRHRAVPITGTPAQLSRSTWQRIRRTLTASVFVLTTIAGIGIGLQGASVSPVSPTTPAAQVTAPVAGSAPTIHHGHGLHR